MGNVRERREKDIERATSIGGYEYLHYWFSNSRLSLVDLNKAKKDLIFFDLKTNFAARKERMFVGGKTQEAEEIMNLLTGTEAASKRKEVFDSQALSNESRDSGINNKTYGSLNKMSAEEINAFIGETANEIANGVNLFQNKLEDFLEQAYNQLCFGPSWQQYQNMVVLEFLNKHSVPGTSMAQLKQQILATVLRTDGMKKLNLTTNAVGAEGSGPLNTSLRNLTLLAWALPELKQGQSYQWNTGGDKTLKTANSVGEIIRVLAGKISGMFSNVKGTGGELALAVAEIEGVGEVLKQIDETIETHAKATGASVRKNYDPQTKELSEIKVSKEDVHVTISKNGGVVIEYGINAKQYTPPKANSNYGHVSIVTDTSFLELTKKAGFSDYELINYAAAHGSRGKGGITNADLNTSWKELVNTIVLKNFLDVIAGYGLTAGDNILFFVVNGRTFTIDEVLEKLSKTNDMTLSNRLTYNKKQLNRSTLMAKNVWKSEEGKTNRAGANKDAKYAEIRSKEAWKQVYDILNTTKISININILGSLMS